jgi:hypothetical protein
MRVVSQIPMTELWDCEGLLPAARHRPLRGTDVAALLRQGTVRFVVADIGQRLRWVPPSDCYGFWKTELQPWIVESDTFDLDNFPGEYCYAASEWLDGNPSPLVLLEKYH